MDWNQSRVSYYADFVVVPVLCTILAGLTTPSLLMIPVGVAIWTLLEYWIHRSIFHRLLRKEHWLHHLRPRAYVAAPAWLTAVLHVMTGLAFLGLGAAGLGTFVGIEAGYLAYVATHDAIHHHDRAKMGAWLRGLDDHHTLHHHGEEKNFGVFTHFWDRRFGTYQDPTAMLARRKNWTAPRGT